MNSKKLVRIAEILAIEEAKRPHSLITNKGIKVVVMLKRKISCLRIILT
jgi:hypothetical protein